MEKILTVIIFKNINLSRNSIYNSVKRKEY